MLGKVSGGTRALRIAMVCPYDLDRPGGVKSQALGLARALSARGHQVVTIAPGSPGRARAEGVSPDVFVAGRSVRARANGSVAPISLSPLAEARALGAARAFRPDVVHVHEPLAPLLGYGFVGARLWPLVGTFHRSGTRSFGHVAAQVTVPLVRWVYGRFDVLAAVSASALDTARSFATTSPVATGGRAGRSRGDDRELPDPLARCEVLFNGVDVCALGAAVPGLGAPRVSGRRPVVLFLGRHERRKGLGTLLEAFESVEGPGTERPLLWIAGDGPETVSLMARYPSSEDLLWLGVLSDTDVARRLLTASLLVAPALGGESFGLVLLEAMATHTAVVCSDIPGYREAASGHATLVAPGDPGALARAVTQVLRCAPDEPKLAAAYAHALNWSIGTLAERYEALYGVAIARRAAALRT